MQALSSAAAAPAFLQDLSKIKGPQGGSAHSHTLPKRRTYAQPEHTHVANPGRLHAAKRPADRVQQAPAEAEEGEGV